MCDRVIAVHGGAGHYPEALDVEVKTALRRACVQALLKEKVEDAVEKAIIMLEDTEIFNAGYGSNLTEAGQVECDASIMSSDGHFGGIGAASCIKNPIQVAHMLLRRSREQGAGESKLISPLVLVAHGALSFASVESATVVPSDSMISSRATREREYWRKKTEGDSHPPGDHLAVRATDTVGAVAICDHTRTLSAGVSSGGILLKLPGRLGAAAVYGAGCWACRSEFGTAFACSVSGAGEAIIRAALARTLCEQLCSSYDNDPHDVLAKLLQSFQVQNAQAGVLLVSSEQDGDNRHRSRLWCAFTTPAMAIAYATPMEPKPKAKILRQSSETPSVCIKAFSLV